MKRCSRALSATAPIPDRPGALEVQIEDPEMAHVRADAILVEMIDDPEVAAAFEAIRRWYA